MVIYFSAILGGGENEHGASRGLSKQRRGVCVLTDSVSGLPEAIGMHSGCGEPEGNVESVRPGHHPPAHCLDEETVVQRGEVTPLRSHSPPELDLSTGPGSQDGEEDRGGDAFLGEGLGLLSHWAPEARLGTAAGAPLC